MANKQHIQWLLEGVEAWNARREREDFVPDLSGVDISKKFQEAGKFDHNYQSLLSWVNFREAKLIGAKLSCADLAYADFSEADLSNANLTKATVAGADFVSTKLINTNISHSQIWKAKLWKAKAV